MEERTITSEIGETVHVIGFATTTSCSLNLKLRRGPERNIGPAVS